MAILEINLEKPALVEEFPAERTGWDRTETRTTDRTGSKRTRTRLADRTGSKRSGGKGKLLGLLVAVAGIAMLARRLRNRGSDTDAEFETADDTEYEHGPEPEIGGDESGGRKRKVAGALGLVVTLVGVLAVARRRSD